MNKYLRNTALFGLLLGVSAAAQARERTATGWISDENCGAHHTKPGGAGCIKKCMHGGQDIGHPEWKPQRMVFVGDAGKRVWVVENPDDLKGHEGEHLRITGQFDAGKRAVRVAQFSILVEGKK